MVPSTAEQYFAFRSGAAKGIMRSQNAATRRRLRSLDVIVTSLSSDAHTWNLVFIQLLLEDLGHRVVNLGPCTPDELIVDACRRHRPDLLVVSTVNGHGYLDATSLIGALRDVEELARMPAVIGGKLDVGGVDQVQREQELLAAGFDAVFEEDVALASFHSFVSELLPGVPSDRR
jgi:methylaspartate mutase sigma subunit